MKKEVQFQDLNVCKGYNEPKIFMANASLSQKSTSDQYKPFAGVKDLKEHS